MSVSLPEKRRSNAYSWGVAIDALLTPALSLLLATGIGLLIGLERGWRYRDEHAGGRIAGIRTFSLLGLGGALCGVVAKALSPWFGVVGLAALSITIILAHRARLAEPDEDVSATNAVVSILTVLLGLLAAIGFGKEALIAGGATALILSMREELHQWLRTLSAQDIKAVAQYGAITLVVLPLLPDRAMGPYEALNPRMLWLVVVFVTGLSFAGYWASKRFGQARGTIVASAIGATYSSTAVTLDLSRHLRSGSGGRATLNAGIAAATALMPLRTLVLCAVVAPSALGAFALRIGPAVLVAGLYALVAAVRASRDEEAEGLKVARNPFDFWPAVGFAVLVAVIIVASHWIIDRFGDWGATFVIGFTGLYDVDAAIIAAANLPHESYGPDKLGFILALPVLANNMVKLVLVLTLAGLRAGLTAAIPLVLVILCLLGGLIFGG